MKVKYMGDDGFNYTFEFDFRGERMKVSSDGIYFSWERYPYEYNLTLEEKRFFLDLSKEIRVRIDKGEGLTKKEREQ